MAPDRRDNLRCLLGIALLGLGLSIRPGSAVADSAPTTQPGDAATAPSPHGSADGCHFCHEPAAVTGNGQRTYRPIPRDAINALCWRCHDGQRAPREIHPVGRFFTGDQVFMPTDWPTQGGKLACVTCHDILSRCHIEGITPKKNPAFLRDNGTQDLLHFCAKCHVAAAMTSTRQYSPHVMLDSDGQPIRNACLFCHQNRFEPGERSEGTGQPMLRADGITLCVGCHGMHIDYFEPGHIGYTAPAWVVQNMIKADRAQSTQPVGAPSQGQAEQQSRRLPLGPGHRIECATCHNPHQAGLFPVSSSLSWGAMEHRRKEERLPLRGLGKDVCWACHNR